MRARRLLGEANGQSQGIPAKIKFSNSHPGSPFKDEDEDEGEDEDEDEDEDYRPKHF